MRFFWLFQTVSESSERMEGGSSLGRFIQAEALEMAYCLGAAWVTGCQKGLWRHDLTARSLALPTPLCPHLKIGAKQMPRVHLLPFIASLPWPLTFIEPPWTSYQAQTDSCQSQTKSSFPQTSLPLPTPLQPRGAIAPPYANRLP